ncbi:MAG: PIG-L deacetylase family protein [Wenzhouxiangellaceae bacterium]
MIGLDLVKPADGALSILCLGAHSDDIEIGAGATVLELARRYPEARIAWHVFAGAGSRGEEARASAEHFTRGYASANIAVHEFRDGYFPAQLADLKPQLEAAKAASKPDVVLTHFRGDLHQDHRTISDVTWQTFRDAFILEYEIAKYDGDLGAPNFFVPISVDAYKEKLESLERFFGSQRSKDWFTADTFSALMRLRGVECRAASGYAEAFYVRKGVLAL